MELAERMRKQNQEQFQTLVRMHLSFELDLHTDENDAAPIGDGKGARFRMRFQFNKKPKAPQALPAKAAVLSKECVAQMRALMDFLMLEHNVIQEGIFRRTGSVARQTELKALVVGSNSAADCAPTPLRLESGAYTVHDCASVLKGVLADLPEPLLTDTYAPAHQQMAELCNSLDSASTAAAATAASEVAAASSAAASTASSKATRLLHSLQLLILLLPAANRDLLREIIEMLNVTARHEPRNKMSADSLATLFTPHLICPKKLTPEALHSTAANLSGIISFMITRGSALFECPPKLATDIRAYFAEQQRKQTMSPEQMLDESVTSDSTANTVYTFVDRERTAQAHDQNPTDTCLAQLYAHIQSLPESSKKRKLIKQFNKENGQGTPLQVQKLHRLKSGEALAAASGAAAGGSGSAAKPPSKSLSDSIKRHIFQKNMWTPKVVATVATATPSTSQQAGATFATPGPSAMAGTASKMAAVAAKATDSFDTPTNPSASLGPAQLPQLKTRVLFQSPATTPNVRPTAASFSNSSTVSALATGDTIDCSKSAGDLSETLAQLQNQPPIKDADSEADEPEIVAPLLRSRHKSEPNLTQILGERNSNCDADRATDHPRTPLARDLRRPALVLQPSANRRTSGGRYMANKLLKGVSMVNLMMMSPSSSAPSTPVASKHSHSHIATTPTLRKATPSPLNHRAERHPCVVLGQSKRAADSDEAESETEAADDNGERGKRAEVEQAAAAVVDAEAEPEEEEEDIDDPDFVATPQSQRSSFGGRAGGAFANFGQRRFSADSDFADLLTPTTRAASFSVGCSGSGGGGGGSAGGAGVGGGAHVSLLLRQHQSQQQQHRQLQQQQFAGRRSMSPITKSTQRMSKAMQESIMTPRSRKPVMLPGALALLGDHHQQQQQQQPHGSQQQMAPSFGSFREQDEDELFAFNVSGGAGASGASLFKSKSVGDFSAMMLAEEMSAEDLETQMVAADGNGDGDNGGVGGEGGGGPMAAVAGASNGLRMSLGSATDAMMRPECLSSPFKNYLLSRSVFTASPVDSSFSSQPDDFGSTPDLQSLAAEGAAAENLSDSLLFCLDGNQPTNNLPSNPPQPLSGVAGSSAAGLQRTPSNSSRKRANGGAEDGADEAEQRQYFDGLHPKKVTVMGGGAAANRGGGDDGGGADDDTDEPNETSL